MTHCTCANENISSGKWRDKLAFTKEKSSLNCENGKWGQSPSPENNSRMPYHNIMHSLYCILQLIYCSIKSVNLKDVVVLILKLYQYSQSVKINGGVVYIGRRELSRYQLTKEIETFCLHQVKFKIWKFIQAVKANICSRIDSFLFKAKFIQAVNTNCIGS